MITLKYYLTSVPHMIHSDSKPRKENIMPDKISSVKRGGRTIIYDPDTGKPTLYINTVSYTHLTLPTIYSV